MGNRESALRERGKDVLQMRPISAAQIMMDVEEGKVWITVGRAGLLATDMHISGLLVVLALAMGEFCAPDDESFFFQNIIDAHYGMIPFLTPRAWQRVHEPSF